MRACRACGWRWVQYRGLCKECARARGFRPLPPRIGSRTWEQLRAEREQARRERDRREAEYQRQIARVVPKEVIADGVLYVVTWDGSLSPGGAA